MFLLPRMGDLLPLQLYGSERSRRHTDAIQSDDMGEPFGSPTLIAAVFHFELTAGAQSRSRLPRPAQLEVGCWHFETVPAGMNELPSHHAARRISSASAR